MLSDLRSMISCRGYAIERIAGGFDTKRSPFSRFASQSERRRTTPPTSGRNVAEVAYVPPQQTPMTQTFRLGWSVASSYDLQAWGNKARMGQAK